LSVGRLIFEMIHSFFLSVASERGSVGPIFAPGIRRVARAARTPMSNRFAGSRAPQGHTGRRSPTNGRSPDVYSRCGERGSQVLRLKVVNICSVSVRPHASPSDKLGPTYGGAPLGWGAGSCQLRVIMPPNGGRARDARPAFGAQLPASKQLARKSMMWHDMIMINIYM
jgi:hypothetical protein